MATETHVRLRSSISISSKPSALPVQDNISRKKSYVQVGTHHRKGSDLPLFRIKGLNYDFIKSGLISNGFGGNPVNTSHCLHHLYYICTTTTNQTTDLLWLKRHLTHGLFDTFTRTDIRHFLRLLVWFQLLFPLVKSLIQPNKHIYEKTWLV